MSLLSFLPEDFCFKDELDLGELNGLLLGEPRGESR